MSMQWKWIATGVCALAASAGSAVAQAPPQEDVLFRKEVRVVPAPGQPDVIMFRQELAPGVRGMPPAGFGPTFDYVAEEMSFQGKPVKGSPYAADAITETTQTLADGNRISRKTTAAFFRDSEGRTRDERTLAAIGPWAAGGDAPQTIFISDPAAGVSYILDPRSHTARKLAQPQFKVRWGEAKAGDAGAAGHTITIHAESNTGGEARSGKVEGVVEGVFEAAVPPPARPLNAKTESLGKQMMEGVEAQGTRSVVTIPAGEIGNERPIEMVSERWYSPELQTVVMSRRNDPRIGETVYRLTNIRRGEQPPTLFEVPADYTLNEEPVMERRFKAWKKAEEAK